MRKAFKRLVFTGILAGLAYAVWRAVQSRMPPPETDEIAWDTAPFPPVPRPASPETTQAETSEAGATEPEVAASDRWVEAADGTCPATHPVKGKLSSGIFHVPGGQNYDRTHADRCYVDAEAAAADGLRQSQR